MVSIFEYGSSCFLNISATVGRTGVNSKDDVFLVQALLNEALRPSRTTYDSRGGSWYSPRTPTGFFSQETNDDLEAFKMVVRMSGRYKTYFVGHIDPIVGNGYAFGSKHLWAMAVLNLFAFESVGRSGEMFLNVMKTRYPEFPLMARSNS